MYENGFGMIQNGPIFRYSDNRCTIYVDIMTEEKLPQIQVAISHRFYWSGRLSSRRRGDGTKEGDGGDRFFSPLQSYIEHENLV